VQLTAPDHRRKLANRELGTILATDEHRLSVRLDSGRTVSFSLDRDRHLDYGYAVTSHSSQGLTADRVLVQVDTAQGGESLVNQRFAYVAVSRGRFDVQLYTNDRSQLADALGREVTHQSALEIRAALEPSAPEMQPSSSAAPQTRAPGHARDRHEIAR
jgi:ATP-dependent exoDNAse (exonuclease V) alpha subunit